MDHGVRFAGSSKIFRSATGIHVAANATAAAVRRWLGAIFSQEIHEAASSTVFSVEAFSGAIWSADWYEVFRVDVLRRVRIVVVLMVAFWIWNAAEWALLWAGCAALAIDVF